MEIANLIRKVLQSRALRSRRTVVGISIIAGILIFVFVGSLIEPYAPYAEAGIPNQPPSPAHPFGTDYEGHDIMSQVIYGAYPTLILGMTSALTATVIGFLAGLFGGYYERLRMLISGATDLILSFPAIVLLTLIGSVFLPTPQLIAEGLVLVMWATCSRAVLPQVRMMKRMPYVEAARTSGLNDRKIIWSIIAPEVGAIAVAYFTLIVSVAIVLAASIQFLGIGNIAEVSWGTILYFAQIYGFYNGDWWWVLAPGLLLALTSSAFGLVGFSLEETMIPRLRV